jgi:alkaline phosphatase
MIEASRIDHGGHANDAAAHLHDTIMYNKVMDLVRHWVDDNPDTVMLSAADHECGGLTLAGFSPLALTNARNTTATLGPEFANYKGDSPAHFLRTTILPAYGIYDATEDEIEALIEHKGKGDFSKVLGGVLADRSGVNWSSGGHSAVDVTLFGYGADCRGRELRSDMAGQHDNTELPYYVEKVLGLDLKKATAALKKNGVDWVPQPDPSLAKREHLHDH